MSTDGGLIALTRNPHQLVALGDVGAVEPRIQVYTGAGQLVETLPWDASLRMVAMGFTFRDELAIVTDDGQVRLYALLVPCPRREAGCVEATPSTHYTWFVLSEEAADLGVAQALVTPDRIWALLRSGSMVEAPWAGIVEAQPRPKVWAEHLPRREPRTWPPVSQPPPRLPSWTASSAPTVLVATDTSVWQLGVEGYEALPIDQRAVVGMSVSPSGKLLAMITESHELHVRTMDGARLLRVWDMTRCDAYQQAPLAPRTPALLEDMDLFAPPQDRGGLGGTGVHALTWCGDDTVALAWSDRVLLLGPYEEPIALHVTGRPYLYGDQHGVRILHGDAHEWVAKVDEASLHALRPGSTHAAAVLVDAAQLAQQNDPRAYEALRALDTRLVEAIDACIEAAAQAWDVDAQQRLLRAALFGKTFVDVYDTSRLLRVSRTLRVLNAVRDASIGMPAVYDEAGMSLLLYRLASREQHKVAVHMCAYLGVRADAVLKHWARAKMARARVTSLEDEEALAHRIMAKFEAAGTWRYADIAQWAWEAGRSRMATLLVEREVRAIDQVPLLLQMHEHALALAKAVESGDTDLIYHVLFALQSSMARGAFFRVIQTLPVAEHDAYDQSVGLRPSPRPTYEGLAVNLLLSYARAQAPDLLRDFYYQDDRHRESGVECVREALRLPPKERMSPLREAQKHFSNDRSCAAEAKRTDEACQLYAFQATLASELSAMGLTAAAKDVEGVSLHDTMLLCLRHNLPKRAERLKHDFRVSDARYFALRVRALIEAQDFAELYRLGTARRPPQGYAPIIAALLHAGHVEEAARFVAKGATSDKANRMAIQALIERCPTAPVQAQLRAALP
ncbi:Vacuolar protein sorting-associated protein 16 [Malassezia pachydermatis]